MIDKIEFTVQGSKGKEYLVYFKLKDDGKLDYPHCQCQGFKNKRKCKHIDGLLNNDKNIIIINGDLSNLKLIKNENSELATNEVALWESEIIKLEKKLSEARIELMKAKDIYYRTLHE